MRITEGAGCSCDGGHKALQLKILNQITMRFFFFQTSSLEGNSSGWHKNCMQTGHCNCFKIARLFVCNYSVADTVQVSLCGRDNCIGHFET